jgi:hypothetical protein
MGQSKKKISSFFFAILAPAEMQAALNIRDFGSGLRRVIYGSRRHMAGIPRIKCSWATERLGQQTIFQGSLYV